MAVQISSWDMDKVRYRVVPETVTDETVETFNDILNDDREVNGWSKDRTVRKTGEVPLAVLYNYALSKGVSSTLMWDFFKADNCKEMKRLLNEFDVFRCGDKFYARQGKL